MTDTAEMWNEVWERVRDGRHTLVMGAFTTPTSASDLKLFRADCSPPWTTKGPLLEICQELEQLLGEQSDSAQVYPADDAGLWQRRPLSKVETVFVEDCNRVFQWGGGHCAVVLEAVDLADEVTLQSLAEILGVRGWLRLPLILCTSGQSSERILGLAALLGLESEVVEAPVVADEQTVTEPAFDWEGLPADVLRVMRGAAVMGQTFEAELLARLLDDSLGSVLQSLQRAADAGAPIADRGSGAFSLPPEALTRLQSKILPSLFAFLNERVGRLLSRSEVTLASGRGSATEGSADSRGGEYSVPDVTTAADPADPPPSVNQEEAARLAEVFEPGAEPVPAASHPQPVTTAETVSVPISATPSSELSDAVHPERDQARAAAHLEAAGKTEEAVRQYLAAARELGARGEIKRALMLNDKALEALEGIPDSEGWAVLRLEATLVRARLQWQGSGLGPPYLLKDALATVEQAGTSLSSRVPKRLQGELAGLKAAICYDLGDLRSLEKALETLTAVSRQLVDAGDPTSAAHLLNDQAAIYLRLGDPVRATHLLSQSRTLFSKLLARRPEDEVLVTELAETEHLLARLVLHAAIRSDREEEAFALSLEYARCAERTYQHLGRHRELARVWETMGRLELARGQPDTAWQLLSAALENQREIGDVTGLARCAAALADLCMSTGRLGDAIRLLVDSISLNHRKGSPIGLAFNRRAIDRLGQLLASQDNADRGGDRERYQALLEMLERAEAVVGQMTLPGEPRRAPVGA
jgi:tetratricopeptide (TPR) repeat protein